VCLIEYTVTKKAPEGFFLFYFSLDNDKAED